MQVWRTLLVKNKMLVTSIFSFPPMFSKGCFFGVINTEICVVKSNEILCLLNLKKKKKQEGHDGPEIAHLSLLTKHAPSSFPVT